MGYSIVDGHSWIRPHYGSTNTQLKLHLGLTVPSDTKKRFCPPAIRVGRVAGDGGIRRWSRGEVLLFDDSFEHEVKNNCDAPPQSSS